MLKGIDAKFVKYINNQRPVNSEDLVDKGFIETYPSDVEQKYLRLGWFGSGLVGAIYVDAVLGDDGNDGASWVGAVKTLQGAVDLLPNVLEHRWTICVAGGVEMEIFNAINLSTKRGDYGTIANAGHLDITFLVGAQTNDFYTNDGERTAFSTDQTELAMSLNPAIAIDLLTLNISAHSDGGFAWGKIKTTGAGFFEHLQGKLRLTGVIFDGTTTANHFIKVNGTASVRLFGCDFVGTGGTLVAGTGQYFSAIALFTDDAGVVGMQLSSETFDATYPSPFPTDAVRLTDIKQFLGLGIGANIINLAMDEGLISSVDQIGIWFNSILSGSVRIDGDITKFDLLGTRTIAVLNDGYCLPATFPTSDPTIAGVLWSNAGIVTVSAG